MKSRSNFYSSCGFTNFLKKVSNFKLSSQSKRNAEQKSKCDFKQNSIFMFPHGTSRSIFIQVCCSIKAEINCVRNDFGPIISVSKYCMITSSLIQTSNSHFIIKVIFTIYLHRLRICLHINMIFIHKVSNNTEFSYVHLKKSQKLKNPDFFFFIFVFDFFWIFLGDILSIFTTQKI